MTKLTQLIMDNAIIEEIKADLYDHIDENNYINQPDEYGRTALHVACCNKNTEAVKLLLEHPKIDVNNQNLNGVTALHMAIICKGINVVKLLLVYPKIDVNITNLQGNTALYTAVYFLQTELIAILLNKNVDINIRNINGRTALDLAKHYERPEMIQLFEEASLKRKLHDKTNAIN